MSITVTAVNTIQTQETLAVGPGDSIKVSHAGMNTALQNLTTGTTPPAQLASLFTLTLSSGAATIDLTQLPTSFSPVQTGATYNTGSGVQTANGMKVTLIKIQNLGAGNLTIAQGGATRTPSSVRHFPSRSCRIWRSPWPSNRACFRAHRPSVPR